MIISTYSHSVQLQDKGNNLDHDDHKDALKQLNGLSPAYQHDQTVDHIPDDQDIDQIGQR